MKYTIVKVNYKLSIVNMQFKIINNYVSFDGSKGNSWLDSINRILFKERLVYFITIFD